MANGNPPIQSGRNLLYLAGSLVTNKLKEANGSERTFGYDLSLYRSFLTLKGSIPVLASEYIGFGLHPDGHAIAFATNADGSHDFTTMWVGTDGGPFSSSSAIDSHRIPRAQQRPEHYPVELHRPSP